MLTKNRLDQLAIFGGPPIIDSPLYVGRPNIGDRAALAQRINDLLDRRWLTNYGPYVQEFERLIAEKIGVRHCIAVCNATIALETLAQALELKGEVILPSFTFIASAHALKWQGITPVFCDIDPQTHNIDPEKVEKCITPRTTGVMGVHVWGRGCDTTALQSIANQYHLKLFFDAAHAFGCSHQGKMIGNFGEAEVFSFHATKFVNSFEGGAVVTNHDGLAEKIRLMINFGFRGYDNVLSVGTNGKMSEVSAAMGITSLESMDQFIAQNHENYTIYHDLLRGLPGLEVLVYDGQEKNNYQYLVVEIDDKITGIDRDLMVKILHAENIFARRYFFPGCHRMEPYRSERHEAGLALPNTEQLVNSVMTLPSGTAVGAEEIQIIASLIRFILEHSDQIQDRLSDQLTTD